MNAGALWESVREDTRRGLRPLLGGALGIALGIAALVFFGALGMGVRDGLLKKVLTHLPLTTVEVRPKGGIPVGFLRFEGSDLIMRPLDATAVEALSNVPGVRAVHPRVAGLFPMRAQGGKALVGRDVFTDIFASGVDEAFLRDELPEGTRFQDSETGPIPAVVSVQLIELFNRAVAPSLGVPAMTNDTVVGFAFTLILGESYSSGKMSGGSKVTVQVVGVSERVMMLGITVPRASVERWNRQYAQEQPRSFASAYIVADDGAELASITKVAEGMGYTVEQNARLAGTMVLALMSTWMLVALLILVVAGFNVAQTLSSRVEARRKELGLLRAVGATQQDIFQMVMAEAVGIAVTASILGLLMGVGAAFAVDALVARYLPRIPFQPETFFLFPAWLPVGAVVAAVVCALLGAVPPARRAAKLDPARALEG